MVGFNVVFTNGQSQQSLTGASFDKLELPIKYENWQLWKNITTQTPGWSFCEDYFQFDGVAPSLGSDF